jgi:hypothetical protein
MEDPMSEPTPWRKSSFSVDNNCAEVAETADGIAMRDSKLGDDSPVLHFTRTELAAFLAGAKAGEFDDLA